MNTKPYACFLVPFPPSLNNNWRSVNGGVVKSKRYREWITEAGWALNRQGPFPTINPPLSVEIALGPPDRRARDLDNHIKPLLDLCSKHNLMRDDSDVHRLTAYWSDEVENGARVEVEGV